MNKGAIFPLFYLPPIEFFHNLLLHKDAVFIEKYEHFQKQTYRNRAVIYASNGKLDLTIPVNKESKNHTSIKDVKISYEFNWQRLHWLSIQAAYKSSAYFEYYEDDFAPFYEKKTEFLFDYNEKLLQIILKALKVSVAVSYTNDYNEQYADLEDFRNSIHPKRASLYLSKPYYQVFEDRNGFLPNLSIIDLLFNKGPQSSQFL